MPYSINNPPSQLNDLSKPAKKVWIKVFNDIYKRYNNETQAFRIAWLAVRNFQK